VPPLVVLAMTHLTVELTSRTDRHRLHATGPAAEGLSQEQSRRLAWDQHRGGRTNKQIADHHGVHPSTVGRWLAAPPPDSEAGTTASTTRRAGAHLTGTDTSANQVAP
jgi:hypothetical protein